MKKNILITGASRGLGWATGIALAQAGHKVFFATRQVDKTKQQLGDYPQLATEAVYVNFDQRDLITEQAQNILAKAGHIDVLINNAGLFLDGRDGGDVSALKTKQNTFEETFLTNTLAPALLMQVFLPGMLARNFGRIVNVSSGMGQLSEMAGGYPAYRMSKSALNALTKSFAAECKGKNVLINSVCPGWVRTEMGGTNATRSIEEGISGIVWAATLPDSGPQAGYFRDGKKLDW